VEVYAPNVGMPIRLKAEDKADPTKSVETEAVTTTANGWQVLTFNFANQAPGTAAINYSFNYNKISLFPNFGVSGATAGEKIFYLGKIAFGTVTASQNLFASGELQFGPNPSSGTLTLSSKVLQGKQVKIEILELLGRAVFSEKGTFAGQEKTIHTGNLKDGIYLLKMATPLGDNIQRISVKN